MWVECITAVAFGPFRSATLRFSPHLTVVCGPNEAGKSSWHAAVYAALCGIRRARGQPRIDDRNFADLRRPWSGDSWEVQAIVRLDDGRRIELRQNLSDLAHCSAIDAELGRDVSSEILNEGTPDATRWLGLDRTSFLSVACVRQAEVQRIVQDASALQDELQRAAASASRDATAADAIAHLESFLRDHVGQERVHSTKPLQRAKVRLAAAETALASARHTHASWLAIEVEARSLREVANQEQRRLRMLRAVRARDDADAIHAKVEKARALNAKYSQGPPNALPDDETLAGEVATALSEWANRPEVPALIGESAATIRADIDVLPWMPVGDQVAALKVVEAKRSYERAVQALDLHLGQRPSDAGVVDAKGLAPDQIRDLAQALEAPITTVDPGRESEYSEAKARLDATERASASRPFVAGVAGLAVVGGTAIWFLGNPVLGAVLAVLGVIALVILVFRSPDSARARALERLRTTEGDVLTQRRAADAARQRVASARGQLAKLGIPADAKVLRRLADEIVVAEGHQRRLDEWSKSHGNLQAGANAARAALEEALRNRGVTELADVLKAFEQYETACQVRAEQAAKAAKRHLMEGQLAAREAAETAVRDAETRRENARARILETARLCGETTGDVAVAIGGLQRWQTERKETLARFDAASREYAELEALLDGRTLQALEAVDVDYQNRAKTLAAEFESLPDVAPRTLGAEIDRCEKAASDASHAATAAETQASERAKSVPSVAEAEEELVFAQSEQERVTRLGGTLTAALEFLGKAEERVHRDIAPVLAQGLKRWLPTVTQGRYADAMVDPSDLNVHVLGPDREWRSAHRLSHGTAEQIYLLLRVVLAERLATTGESCPLVLDDVLVQSDRARKHSLLSVIDVVSRSRQVILFSQEEEVLAWAQQNVAEPNLVVILPGPVECV